MEEEECLSTYVPLSEYDVCCREQEYVYEAQGQQGQQGHGGLKNVVNLFLSQLLGNKK